MEKNSDYKHNIELASCDLDDFFLSCHAYGIAPSDVISCLRESLSSFLEEFYKCHNIQVSINFKGGVKHG